MYGPNGLHAFEIKHTTIVTNKMLKGLRAFKEDYPQARIYVIYQGNQKEYYDDIAVIPFQEVLRDLPKILAKP